MDIITFNGKSFRNFATFFDGSQLFTTPEKEVNFYSVPGRSGDLSVSQERYKNKTVSINCFIRDDFRNNYSNLMNYLLSQDGYGRLETTKETDIFQMAQFVNEIKPTTYAFLKSGTFTLTFNCQPQKWLKSGENAISITNSATVYNPTNFTAKPLIAVSGTGSITINGITMTLSANNSTTYIDCDIQDAYEGVINRNSYLSIPGGFPALNPGDNSVSVSGCTIDLYPRWWKL